MTVGELITQINLDSNDILDDEVEYIPYINAAIDYLSMVLVSIKDREVIKTIDITDNLVVPTDFMGFLPKSGYPVRTVSGVFKTYSGDAVTGVSYTIKKNHIGNNSDVVPFSELYYSFLVQLVSFLVKKKSLMMDFASFDKTFISDLTNAVLAAKGG